MGNSIINWIEQWLKDRRQRVVVDGEVSSWKPVLSGVPQGSVLGPILFLIYINDLEEGVTGNILKFADDTKLFRKVKEIGDKQKLQDDIDKLVKWSEKWQRILMRVHPLSAAVSQHQSAFLFSRSSTRVIFSSEQEPDHSIINEMLLCVVTAFPVRPQRERETLLCVLVTILNCFYMHDQCLGGVNKRILVSCPYTPKILNYQRHICD